MGFSLAAENCFSHGYDETPEDEVATVFLSKKRCYYILGSYKAKSSDRVFSEPFQQYVMYVFYN